MKYKKFIQPTITTTATAKTCQPCTNKMPTNDTARRRQKSSPAPFTAIGAHFARISALYLFFSLILYCLLLVLTQVGIVVAQGPRRSVKCYDDETKNPQKCFPEFINAAYSAHVEATNTCGLHGPTYFCYQTTTTGAATICDVCNANDSYKAHLAEQLTDLNDRGGSTWWQSETLEKNVEREEVNITISFHKSFDITYVRLLFKSPRPSSFAIYKRTCETCPWIAYQYYSKDCQDMYNRPDMYLQGEDIIIDDDSESQAFCTSEYSDISPLTGGTIAFSTLENRPGAIRFDDNEALQNWVTATDIKISLKKLNTFGDQIFSDVETAQTYFYAISDIAVGGRCKCNGHANECSRSSGIGLEDRWVCNCQHNTEDADCGKCQSFFQDRPWKRATIDDPNVCVECNCNSNSRRCYFDKELYFLSGNKTGGHCTNCERNTDGPHCERCKPDHFRLANENRCLPCLCDAVGSHNAQCTDEGQCRCKPGVGGLRCQSCLPNYYGFSPLGCTPCGCESAGSLDNSPTCGQETGQCVCKANVEGQNCDKCKPGYFDLSTRNQFGCLKCFCNGHSAQCQSDEEYVRSERTSRFLSLDSDGWTAEYDDGRKYPFDISSGRMRVVAPDSGGTVYFIAPKSFLGVGEQPGLGMRASYGQFLEFTLAVDGIGPRVSVKDIVLEGYISPRQFASVALPLYAQGNPPPKKDPQQYKFRLHEHRDYSWQPRMEAFEFQSLLSNITALKIHANFAHKGITYLSDVRLETAERGGAGEAATYIERCECPKGFVGEWCQDCASGFKRQIPYGGALARCIPCTCNNHSDYCEPESGNCACRHNTAESDCSVCARGFYGNALNGTPDDCKPCPCPNGSSCAQMRDGEVVCLECPEGYAGSSCDMCADGYFGDPAGKLTGGLTPIPCRKCECSGNIDPNDVGNCNTTTGECLRCTRHTVGFQCERCSPGYFGSALAGNCTACKCYPPGSIATSDMFTSGIIECDQGTGQCPCKTKVAGRQCDTCLPGYYNVSSGVGCQRCDCDLDGAYSSTCDINTGKCNCRPGVGGRACGSCLPYHYGTIVSVGSSALISTTAGGARGGCKECNCDPTGSTSAQCDPLTGQCPCQDRVVGRRCDMCQENHYGLEGGCHECEACYRLVQDAIEGHRKKLDELRGMLQTINSSNIQAIFAGAYDKQVDNPEDFRDELNRVRDDVNNLRAEASRLLTAGGINTGGVIAGDLVGRVNDFQRRIQNVQKTMVKITDHAVRANRTSEEALDNMKRTEQLINNVYNELQKLRDFININARQTLERAQDASNRFGQTSTRMSEIAREARRLADEHTDRAKRVSNTASTALNTSRAAVDLIDDIVEGQRKNDAEVAELVKTVERMEADMENTKSLAEKARMGAEKAYRQSLDTFTKVKALTLPKVNPKELNKTAVDIEAEATRVRLVADEMLNEAAKLAESLALESRTAQELLNEAEQTQKNTDRLLADARLARNRSVEARQRANAIVEEARQTLKTLQEFDARRQASRSEAERELGRIDEIESAIRRAEETAQKASDSLRNAIDTASEAKSLALRAQQLAEEAAKEAQGIQREAAQASKEAVGLRESAQKLAQNVGSVQTDIDRLTQQATTEDTQVATALARAGRASAVARNASDNAKDTLKAVDQLLAKLQMSKSPTTETVEQIDENQLAVLEEQVQQVADLLESSRLPTTVKQLESARTEHRRQMEMLKMDIADLEDEVVNIEAIKNTLPKQCFKRERIEVGAEADA